MHSRKVEDAVTEFGHWSVVDYIYSAVYGFVSDADVRWGRDKRIEIYDWLFVWGDLEDEPTLEDVINEWREYDAEDIARKAREAAEL